MLRPVRRPGSIERLAVAPRRGALLVPLLLTALVTAADARAAGPRERPLPAFSGTTLDGRSLSSGSFIGKRVVLYFFNPEVAAAVPTTRAVRSVAALRGDHNFEVIGIAVGSTRSTAREFARAEGIDFPVIDDSGGTITRKLGLRSPLALLGADAEGFLSFGMGAFPTEVPDAAAVIEDQIRERLRLPERGAARDGQLFDWPEAPSFQAEVLGEDAPFDSASLAGRPYVLIFFLHTCPHCHKALAFLKEELPKLPEDKRPELVAISAQYRPTAVRSQLQELGLDFFPVLFDPGEEAQSAFGVFTGIPDLMLIDDQGRIRYREQGWDPKRHAPLLRMHMAQVVGAKVPMLLNPRGYTGNDVCGVCHAVEEATWQFTSHSTAYDTLVKHGKERDAECVSCHVVGFEKPGGYDLERRPAHLEDVGCESCHGRGGPHLSPGFVSEGYEGVCGGCHNPEHSLGFAYESFHPKISHARLAKLAPAEREALLAARGKPRDLLPQDSEYVGSKACQSCHTAEYETWAASPHARAVKTLADKDEAGNSDCLRCHTTGFGKPGGFPAAASAAAGAATPGDADLARVGCESCHGPGGNHVKEDVPKLGSIVSLGDKCDSCVILQICGSCHDDANDPGFEFEVQEKIERQRHGTIEAGTGRKLEARSVERHLQEAFALLDRRAGASSGTAGSAAVRAAP